MDRRFIILIFFAISFLSAWENKANDTIGLEQIIDKLGEHTFLQSPGKYTDQEIFDIFQAKANEFIIDQQDSSIIYVQALGYYGKMQGSSFLEAMGYRFQAKLEEMRGNRRKSLLLYEMSVPLLSEYPLQLGYSYQALGGAYIWLEENDPEKKGHLDSADVYLHKGFNTFLDAKDSIEYSNSYNYLGRLYFRQKRYQSSIEAHLKALEFTNKARSPLVEVTTYFNLARTYRQLDDFDNSNAYAEKGLNLSDSLKYQRSTAQLKSFLGLNKYLEGNYDDAIKNFTAANVYFESRDYQNSLISNYAHLSLCHLQQNKIQKAAIYLQKARSAIAQNPEQRNSLAFVFAEAEIELIKRNYLSAEKKLLNAVSMDFKVQSHFYIKKAWQSLGMLYQRQGLFDEALAIKDSIIALDKRQFEDNQKNIIYDYATKYETTKKEQAIVKLNQESEFQRLELDKKRKQLSLSLLTIFFAIIGIGGVMYALRIRNRSNEKLSETNTVLSKTVGEKELLIKEIHHRVKNNLQVISGLLKWQSSFIKDKKALSAFNEGQNRVQSMAIIHQKLYQSDDLMSIDMKDYVSRLSESLVRSYNLNEEQIELTTNIEPLNLDIDTVIPLGLILNELISNALKHAFPNQGSGEIVINLSEDSTKSELLLVVSDNGVGMKDSENAIERQSFGMELVETLSKKLKADLIIENHIGTTVRLVVRNYKLPG